jgi:hypothetical protein
MSIDITRTLPWEHNGNGLINGQSQADEDEAPFIADVCESSLDCTPEEKAKAEFITRACNTHGALREALVSILLCDIGEQRQPKHVAVPRVVIDKARLAVAKATSENCPRGTACR